MLLIKGRNNHSVCELKKNFIKTMKLKYWMTINSRRFLLINCKAKQKSL